MLEDYDRNSEPLGAYPLRNGPTNTVDDISSMSEHEALTPGPIRPDVDGVLKTRAQWQSYRSLATDVQALADRLLSVPRGSERVPEGYDAQKLLLEAAGRLRDAAQRMESGHE